MLTVLLLFTAGAPAFAGNMDQAAPGQAESMDDVPMIIDVLVLRPMGFASCVIGLAASIIALPFALPSKSTDKVYQTLIVEPFQYTFMRPLGKSK